mmetsp:Transcript_18925/g.36807  ORF Transcript_18925/g.36807 Transcript_18925/m.36807 type:complete len:613 (-) Transcript_18925:243-2081(-)
MSRRFDLKKSLSSIISSEEKKSDDDDNKVPTFLTSSLGPKVAAILDKHAESIHDDSFLKIIRQLEFWYADQKLPEEDFLALAERLAKIACWRENLTNDSPDAEKFTIPKVRFGKTELQMPIVTCGGMRVQETWIPDVMPLLRSNKSKVVKSASQDNLKNVIMSCLKIGLNHFETARFYGSSEIQFVAALVDLMNEGVVKREDFIFQTKVFPMENKSDFVKQWNASWSNVEKLGFVDLLSFHCVSDDKLVGVVTSDDEDGLYKFVEGLKKEGKIRHIGFSTHGSAEVIMRMINSEKFEYVNIHKHFFGDYHAAGTPDTMGGQGNAACVKRALELDMGVFQISPFDKGGKLYRPSATVAAAIGPELSPIAFAALHSWKTQKIHTASVGFARPSDLDEVIEAARLYGDEKSDELLKAAEGKLNEIAIDKLGKDWFEKGLLNVPSCYNSSTDGQSLGQMLWLHNCLTAYGMYEFSSDRYRMLEGTKWTKGKSFEENVKKNFNAGNPGRSYDASVDITEALKDHFDPELARVKIAECHELLTKGKKYTEEEKADKGWKQAYNLTTWEEFPGEAISVSNVLLNRMGLKDVGPNKKAAKEAMKMRNSVRNFSSLDSGDS